MIGFRHVEAHHLEFAVCLDALGQGSVLRMHVSKAPKDNSPIEKFQNRLTAAAASRFGGNRTTETLTKKINLGDEFLGWEHERYNIRKLAAFTLSHFANPADPWRRTILDRRKRLNVDALRQNVEIIAEALVNHLYDLPEHESAGSSGLIDARDGIKQEMLESWIDRLSEVPRGSQVLAEAGAKDALIADLLHSLDLHTHEATTLPVNVDKKDPEFVLYGATADKIVAYRVKPAVFDLFLAALITGYLGLLYFLVMHVEKMRLWIQHFSQAMIKLKQS